MTNSHFTKRALFRRTAGTLTAAGTLALAACGPQSGPGGTPSRAGTEGPPSPNKTPVTLTVWHGARATPDTEARSQTMLRTFEAEHPHVRIDWQVVPWAGAGQMLAKLPIAAASGDLPDTFRSHWSIHGSVIHQGWVRPLDTFWKAAGAGRKDFTPSTWDLTVCIFYNYWVTT